MLFSNLTEGQDLMISRRWTWSDSYRLRLVHPLVGFQIDFQVERLEESNKILVLRPTPYWRGEFGYTDNPLHVKFVSPDKLEFVKVETDFELSFLSGAFDQMNETVARLFGETDSWGAEKNRTADMATLCLESGSFRVTNMPVGTGELQILTRAKMGEDYFITILDVENADPVKMRIVRVFAHNYKYCVVLARSDENNEVCPSPRLLVALQSSSMFETLSDAELFEAASEYLTLCEMRVPANVSETLSIFGEFVDVTMTQVESP
ncbi:MAG: hypothetical protein K2Z81_15125 [Cyanobacteria bacterium]|nr:hypothetical protein [Cyanobacteriota bacterium]